MKKSNLADRFKVWFKFIYHQLVEIDDTPHRKALGLAIGVFLGIFPGTGPMAALVVSFILRVNRAAALVGSTLTNTWLSVVTLGLAIKIGARLRGDNWQKIHSDGQSLMKDFHWHALTQGPILNLLGSVILGFVIVGGLIALGVYGAALSALILRQKAAQHKRENFYY